MMPSQKLRNLFLSFTSIAIISYYDLSSAIIIITLTIYSYYSGKFIFRTATPGVYHKLSIIGLIIFLIIFKYLGLLTSSLESVNSFFNALPQIKIIHILLPLGISYIIFKHISYLTDIYWKIIEPGSLADLLLYSSLFTIFVAGPIERFERFKPQINDKITYNSQYLNEGFMRIVIGLFKKLVIADWIGYFITPVFNFSGEYSVLIRFLSLIGYSLQIYFDFSGYSDIAIGSSKVFGFKIMENFNYPYLQVNISQFWRNWHISLSDWIRDYVFFPLSRLNRSKFYVIIIVPIIAMGICGLWHGPEWHFLIWGISHGIAIAVFQIWSQLKRKYLIIYKISELKTFNILSTVLTFLFVTFSWLLFI